MYIFTEVTIDPNNLNQPIIETDAIVFSYENQVQKINLVAWGRDAYFHSGIPDDQQYSPQSENLASMEYCDFYATFGIDCPEEYIGESFNYYSVDEHTTWTNDKPHVIYGNLIVENGAILTMQAGSEIYLHNNSSLLVSSASSIHANGTINNLIWFQSDRSDSHSLTDYANTPGQWGKIWILPGSVNNIFNYAILKNGQTGIQIDGVDDIANLPIEPTLTLKNSIIYNMSSIGLFAQGSRVHGENLLMFNCGQHLLALNTGGAYRFQHCTFANFWPFSRQTPSIFLNNYYTDIDGNIQNRDLLEASFENCIIDGNNETEIIFDKSDHAMFNYKLDYCILKSSEDYWQNNWQNTISENVNLLINNATTGFINYEINDFQLDSNSIALDIGSTIIAKDVPYDLNGINRLTNPDIGCFEKQ